MLIYFDTEQGWYISQCIFRNSDNYSMNYIIAVILLFVSLHSNAKGLCDMGQLIATNKSLHLIGSATIVRTVSTLSNVDAGIAAAVAIGTARELYKVSSPSARCEYSSILYDVAGIYLGVTMNKHIMVRGNMVIWSTDF